jgi:hypothetical protein
MFYKKKEVVWLLRQPLLLFAYAFIKLALFNIWYLVYHFDILLTKSEGLNMNNPQ